MLVFDEDTPAAALERLRPDVWAKGGDYAGRSLPEAAVARGLGRPGRRSALLAGNSTTRIIEEASPFVPSAEPTGASLVTGGASGLGAAIAHAVEAAGSTPVVFDLKPSANGFPARARRPLRHPARRGRGRAVAEEHGGLRGVVTAAGIDACGRLDDIDGAALGARRRRQPARHRGGRPSGPPAPRVQRGRIVTVASTLGLKAVSDATAYCASKFGVVGFTRALAAETAAASA